MTQVGFERHPGMPRGVTLLIWGAPVGQHGWGVGLHVSLSQHKLCKISNRHDRAFFFFFKKAVHFQYLTLTQELDCHLRETVSKIVNIRQVIIKQVLALNTGSTLSIIFPDLTPSIRNVSVKS